MPDVLTIRGCSQRAKTEDIPLTEYTIRCWIKTGAIPYRTVGKKVLIYYPNLIRHLMATDGTDHTPAYNETAAGIRRVEM